MGPRFKFFKPFLIKNHGTFGSLKKTFLSQRLCKTWQNRQKFTRPEIDQRLHHAAMLGQCSTSSDQKI